MPHKPSKSFRGSDQNGRIFNRDRWTCAYCKFPGNSETSYAFLVADHIDPNTKSDDDFDPEFDAQKITACIYCNQLKGRYVPKGNTRDEKLRDAIMYVQAAREKALQWFKKHYQTEEVTKAELDDVACSIGVSSAAEL
jgi:hypothetical protein